MPALSATASRILDVAEALAQTQGFNGFSYADISAELGIRKASLHHHFPTKAQLGKQLISRYQQTFLAALAKIDERERSPRKKLERYAGLYRDVLERKRMCLCGMLAAELDTLPRAMRSAVQTFFSANEAWLSKVLEDGRRTRVLRFEGPAPQVARFIVGSLEGAMLVARTYGTPARFDAIAKRVVGQLAHPTY